ncbi:MAG: YaiO family outer membrane beta-barrel protein, partial [Pseudomonadota bacterium]
ASGLGEMGRHPLYDTLPKYALYNQVTRTLPGGWGLGFGVRQSEYTFGSAQVLSLSAERYFGSFRSAYTLYSGGYSGALNSAQRFQFDYLYGDRNTVGLSYTMGRDFEQPVLGIGVPLNDVRDFTLSGRHWFSPNWALTYDLSQDQGPLLRRQGLRLGVSRSF